MKQIYLAITALVLFLIIGAGSASAAGSFAIGDASGLVSGSDQTIRVPVNVTGANGFDSFTLQFSFDTTAANGATARLSSTTPAGISGAVNNNMITATVSGQSITGEKTIAYLDVKPGTTAGKIGITITPTTISENVVDVTGTYTVPSDLNVTITAGPAKISEITASPSDASKYKVGSTVVLSAQVLDNADTPVTSLKPTWTSSSPGTVYVDENGNCQLRATGDATITASLPGYSSIPAKTFTITVLGAYSELDNTVKNGAKLDGWNNITGANATYTAAITGTAYEITVPQYTRDLITAPILQTGDADPAVKATWKGDVTGNGDLTVTNGKITIPATDADSNTEYTVVFTGRMLGDVDGNGKVNVIDATLITKYYAGIAGSDLTEYQKFYADVNGKSQVTAADALAIMEMTVGLRYGDYTTTPDYWNS